MIEEENNMSNQLDDIHEVEHLESERLQASDTKACTKPDASRGPRR